MRFTPQSISTATHRSPRFTNAAPTHKPALDGVSDGVVASADRIMSSRAKRTLDVGAAAALVVLSSPMLGAAALAIKLTSPGPVFFRQQRYGAGGRRFWIWKFRTMRVMETEGAFAQASRRDARVTRVGAFLRKTSIDELPQLFNVLEGTMSLVGPRPHAIVMDDHFRQIIPALPARHLVRPGLTGLAQVSGYRGPTEDAAAMEGRVHRDIAYIRTWSLRRDIAILLRTPGALLRTRAF